jgi:WD40 repeat protein
MKKILLIIICSTMVFSDISGQDTIWTKRSNPSGLETYSVAFSDDGTKVFSGSECHPASLKMFLTTDGTELWNYELTGSLMCVSGVKFSSSGKKIACIEEMGNLLIFDYSTTTPSLIKSLNTVTSGAFALDFSDDGTKVAVGAVGSKLLIFDIASGSIIHNITAHSTWVQGVDWSGSKIATGGNDNLVKLWDSAGNYIRSFIGHTGAVLSVQFSKDGTKIISASADNSIKLWDVATGTLIQSYAGHTDDVLQARISEDGTKIVSGGKDAKIKIWNTSSGANLMTFARTGSGVVYSVDFSNNGKFICAGTSNGDVQLWDITKATAILEQATRKDNLNLYPNPSANSITVNFPLSLIGQIIVTNVTGEMQKITKLYSTKNAELDISNFSLGQYFIKIVDLEGNVFTQSFMKQ